MFEDIPPNRDIANEVFLEYICPLAISIFIGAIYNIYHYYTDKQEIEPEQKIEAANNDYEIEL